MNHAPKDEISREAAYQEMYNEARRHRDHEFTSSTWFTALLLGILGFLIATRFGSDTSSQHWAEFASKPLIRRVVLIICFLIALASTLLVRACHQRYYEIRKWLDTYLEPDFKKTFDPAKHFVSPHYIYYVAPWVAVATIAILLFA